MDRIGSMTGNLGPLERRKRFILGIIALASACTLVVATAMNSIVVWVLVFILFWIAGLGLFQAKEKT
jgi:hypothetical protein